VRIADKSGYSIFVGASLQMGIDELKKSATNLAEIISQIGIAGHTQKVLAWT
jgi:hypothetical protein